MTTFRGQDAPATPAGTDRAEPGHPAAPTDRAEPGHPAAPTDRAEPGHPAAHTDRAEPAHPAARTGLLGRLLRGQSLSAWFVELVRFLAVGGSAYVVDVGLFNLLRFGPGELLGDKPLTAKVVSVTVAVVVAWLGNRYWTFAGSRQPSRRRELTMFALVNLGGMAIAVGVLAVSHYVLGFTSPLADNIAANGVGLVLGTAFRYVCYRYLVFTADGGAAPR